MDLMLLITQANMLAKQGKVQQAFKLIDTAKLRGNSENILDKVFDKFEYNSVEKGFINEKELPNSHMRKDYYVREIGGGLTAHLRKSDIFRITHALQNESEAEQSTY